MSGITSQFIGWRSNFLLLGGLFLVAAMILLREARHEAVRPAAAVGTGGLPGLVRQYGAVVQRGSARVVLAAVAVEGFLFYGAFTYLSAWLRHRFDLGWTAIGLTVACFGIGGLVFSATVRRFVHSLGETGLPLLGGGLMATGFLAIPLVRSWPAVPLLVVVLGLGFYMFHNTLQTNSTQMVPEARGTAVSVFATCLFLGQGIGAAALGRVVDGLGYGPMFGASGVLLGVLGIWFRRAKMAWAVEG